MTKAAQPAGNTTDTIFKRESIVVNGVKVVMLRAGKGQPLLVLHGATTLLDFDFALPLTKHYTVLIPYHPGFGESDDAPHLLQIHDYVLHYLELIDQLSLNRVRILGCCFGGSLAAEFAMEHDNRLEKLVLVSPTGLDVPDYRSTDLFMIPPEHLPAYFVHNPDMLSQFLPRFADPNFATTHYRELTTLARITWEHPYSAGLCHWLHRVAIPTMIVWGAEDRITPVQQAKVWAGMIRGSTLKIVPNGGHLVLEERPEIVNDIAEFLEQGPG